MLLTISAARRSASSPPMARLRLAIRSLRNALLLFWMDRTDSPHLSERNKIASGNAEALFRLT